MIDQVKKKLLEHAQLVCQTILGTESLGHLHIYADASEDDSLPLPISPTHQFMVLIDFSDASDRLLEVQKGFASFLGKTVGIQEADHSKWLYWGEGEKLTPMPALKTQTKSIQPSVDSISDGITWLKTDTILPSWLDRLLYESLGARYEPDWKKFEYNLALDADALRVYLGTYFPRSYAEAFCILDALFDTEAYAAHWKARTEAFLLDIGCGTGGNLIGMLTALAKHFPHIETIHVEGFDGNAEALDITRRVLEAFVQQSQIKISLSLTKQHITTAGDLPPPLHDSYDFIMSFKMAGEIISHGRGACNSFYHNLLATYIDSLSDTGLFILLDVTIKPDHQTDFYPQLLNHQVSSYLRDHAGYGTIFPISCHIHEQNCAEHCFSQKEFYVSHQKNMKDLSRVAYRIVGHKALADIIHHDTDREGNYIICTRKSNQTVSTCAFSPDSGIPADGYKIDAQPEKT